MNQELHVVFGAGQVGPRLASRLVALGHRVRVVRRSQRPVEVPAVELLSGEPKLVATPSASGAGQRIARCPRCRVAVWSHYAGAGDAIRFVRVGTLDEPGRLPPDIHIFTASKQPWVVLPTGTPAVAEYYDRKQYWPAESLARRDAMRAKAARKDAPPR